MKSKQSHKRDPLGAVPVNPVPNNSKDSIPAANSTKAPLCEICDEQEAVLYCAQCSMNICETNGCDSEMHANAKTKNHVRKPLSQ
jgi:hypothetical protein